MFNQEIIILKDEVKTTVRSLRIEEAMTWKHKMNPDFCCKQHSTSAEKSPFCRFPIMEGSFCY